MNIPERLATLGTPDTEKTQQRKLKRLATLTLITPG